MRGIKKLRTLSDFSSTESERILFENLLIKSNIFREREFVFEKENLFSRTFGEEDGERSRLLKFLALKDSNLHMLRCLWMDSGGWTLVLEWFKWPPLALTG